MGLGHILQTAVNAIAPIIALILLGYLLRQKGFLTQEFVKIGNRLVFHVCLPCMLFVNVYDIASFASVHWDIVVYGEAAILVIFLLGLATAVATTRVSERRGVILQCAVRSNYAIIGLSLAAALGGEEAVATAAVVSAFAIPTFNILAVIALSIFMKDAGGKKRSVGSILRGIATNPLIIGVALGLLALGIRALQQRIFGRVVFSLSRDVKFVYTALSNLKSVATPLALIVLGGQFTFSAVKGMKKEILVGTLWRNVLAPLIGIGGAVLLSRFTGLLDFGVNDYPALIALFGSPVAVSSAVMAGEMGNDEQLATQLVAWTSVCSIVTVFLQVCILMLAGLLAV